VGPCDSEIGAKRAALKRSAFGKIDARERGERLRDPWAGMFLAFELDVDLGGFASRFVRAAEMSSGAADLERGWNEDAGVFAKIVFGIEIDGEGNAAGEPPAMSKALESLACLWFRLRRLWIQACYRESRRPPSPREGSRKPVEARFKELTLSLAESGVSAASA